MTLDAVKTALLTVTSNVHHRDATLATGNYIVWAEESQSDSVWANNKMKEQAISGTIDYFTSIEYDPNFDAIQAALSNAGISFRWNSTQDEGAITHYEWVFEVV